MNTISKIVLKNLQLKAGDLNVPGKLEKLFIAYNKINANLEAYADSLSKSYNCGNCGKQNRSAIVETKTVMANGTTSVKTTSPLEEVKQEKNSNLSARDIEEFKQEKNLNLTPRDIEERINYYTALQSIKEK